MIISPPPPPSRLGLYVCHSFFCSVTLDLGWKNNRCIAAEPAQGELWTSVSKLMENRRLSKADILKKVVAAYFADGAIAVLAGGPVSAGGSAGTGGAVK